MRSQEEGYKSGIFAKFQSNKGKNVCISHSNKEVFQSAQLGFNRVEL